MTGSFSDLITPLFEPLGLIWVVLLAFVVVCLRQKCRAAALALFLVCSLLSVVGSTEIPFMLVATLEQPYIGKTVASARPGDAVVMLGGGFHFSQNDAFHLGLSGDATRVLAAIEAARERKGEVLVVSGGDYQDPRTGRKIPDSPIARAFINSWNLCPVPVLTLEHCSNTHEESMGVQKLALERHWKRVVLVTSAYHLARAEAVFRQPGLQIEIVACDFKSIGVEKPPFSLFPSAPGFHLMHVYLHEQIGWWVYRLHGWINS